MIFNIMRFKKLLFILVFIPITSFSQFVKNIEIPFYKNLSPKDIKLIHYITAKAGNQVDEALLTFNTDMCSIV